jgi:hypothetical protein
LERRYWRRRTLIRSHNAAKGRRQPVPGSLELASRRWGFGSAQKSQSRSLPGMRSYWPGAAALDAFSLSPASSGNRLTSGGADGFYAGFARFAAI